MVEKLGEIEQAGDDLRREAGFTGPDGKLRGIYGVQVKVGLGGQEIKMEPFGNLKRNTAPGSSSTREAEVHELREPVCDVFEEQDELVIIAEMPGVSLDDLQLGLEGDLLTIEATGKTRKYFKELHLPFAIDLARLRRTANNGVVELRCPR